jgi:hypothetical protein
MYRTQQPLTLGAAAAGQVDFPTAVQLLTTRSDLAADTKGVLLAKVLLDGTYNDIVNVSSFVDLSQPLPYKSKVTSGNYYPCEYMTEYRSGDSLETTRVLEFLAPRATTDDLFSSLCLINGSTYYLIVINELKIRDVTIPFERMLWLTDHITPNPAIFYLNDIKGITYTPEQYGRLLLNVLSLNGAAKFVQEIVSRDVEYPSNTDMLNAMFRAGEYNYAYIPDLTYYREALDPITHEEYLKKARQVRDKRAVGVLLAMAVTR